MVLWPASEIYYVLGDVMAGAVDKSKASQSSATIDKVVDDCSFDAAGCFW